MWPHVPYSPLFGSAGPSEQQAAELEQQPELEEEPSAPPLFDQPWAQPGADGCDGTTAGLPAAPPPVQQQEPQRYSKTWGCAAALGASKWTSESSVEEAPAGAGVSPCRSVSEETLRYQALLETLAERRRAAAAAEAAEHADSDAVPEAAPWLHAEGGRAERAASSSSEEGVGLLQLPLAGGRAAAVLGARPLDAAAPLAAASAGGQRCGWLGVQTLLNNLRIATDALERKPAPAVSFWEQPVTDGDEVVLPACQSPETPPEALPSSPLSPARHHTVSTAMADGCSDGSPPKGLVRRFSPLAEGCRRC